MVALNVRKISMLNHVVFLFRQTKIYVFFSIVGVGRVFVWVSIKEGGLYAHIVVTFFAISIAIISVLCYNKKTRTKWG